jgi:hypothetical protein
MEAGFRLSTNRRRSRYLPYVGLTLLLAMLANYAIAAAASEPESSPVGGRNEAQQLIEKALAAKGGRDRIQKARNVLFVHGKGRYRSLLVPPGRLWEWIDSRGDKYFDGLEVRMFDPERNVSYLAFADEREARRLSPPNGELDSNYTRNALAFLVEPNGIDLDPVDVVRMRINGRMSEVVRVRSGVWLVGFVFDPTTHLPSAFVENLESRAQFGMVLMRDYVDVGGIQMPSKVSFGGAAYHSSTFEVNVDIEAHFFERPPRVADGPDAFRSRSGPAELAP